MNGSVAIEAQAGEVLERVVRLILVDVVHVYSEFAVRYAAGLTLCFSMLPTFPRISAISFEKIVLFLLGRTWASALLISFIPHIGCLVACRTVNAKTKSARLSAVNAETLSSPFLSFCRHAVFIPFRTFGAQGFAVNDAWVVTANANLQVSSGDCADAVLMNSHAPCNFGRITSLLQQFESFCSIDILLGPGHVATSNDRIITSHVLSSTLRGRRSRQSALLQKSLMK